MLDFIIVFCCSLFALLGHAARKHKALEWLVRVVIALFCFGEAVSLYFSDDAGGVWSTGVLATVCVATGLLLLIPFRKLLSVVCTAVDGVVSLRMLTGPLRHHLSVGKSIVDKKIFVPQSIPHMVGLFLYITTMGYFLQATSPLNFDFPVMPFPLPVSLMQLFSYNGLGLVMVSFCGIGIFVSRNWREAFKRLGWEKPTWAQVGIAFGLVVFSFTYDLLWSLYTHGLGGQDLATKLSAYNSGTFASGGEFGTSIILALATAIFAGVGEETLIRGAIQPALGIVPAAILHGVLHAQFSHAPIFIIQVALWSIVIGLVRRFTNTTTTIMGHAGFNFVTTFLFAFNP